MIWSRPDISRKAPESLIFLVIFISASLGVGCPEGLITPSEADIKITKKLVEAGKLLDIAVLDHLIIGQDQFYSFADEGCL